MYRDKKSHDLNLSKTPVLFSTSYKYCDRLIVHIILLTEQMFWYSLLMKIVGISFVACIHGDEM